MRRPYVLITGENDLGVPNECRHAPEILNDPHLVKWFAQNNDAAHPKIIGIPIGLNCFEHAPEMHHVLQEFKEHGMSVHVKASNSLLLIDFTTPNSVSICRCASGLKRHSCCG